MIEKETHMTEQEIQKLIERAIVAREKTYSPYSHFGVGAALVCEDGSIYEGCNIENASYGATNCAERTAVFKAVSEGYTQIERIAIVSSSHQKTPPCGICRQVLAEFMTENAQILLADKDGIESYTIKDLLPESFKL